MNEKNSNAVMLHVHLVDHKEVLLKRVYALIYMYFSYGKLCTVVSVGLVNLINMHTRLLIIVSDAQH